MGVFEGETKEDAIRAMNVDAWCDPDDADGNDGLTVEEAQLCDCCGHMAPRGLVYTLPSGSTQCHNCSIADSLVY
jgi:hypothetical protein